MNELEFNEAEALGVVLPSDEPVGIGYPVATFQRDFLAGKVCAAPRGRTRVPAERRILRVKGRRTC